MLGFCDKIGNNKLALVATASDRPWRKVTSNDRKWPLMGNIRTAFKSCTMTSTNESAAFVASVPFYNQTIDGGKWHLANENQLRKKGLGATGASKPPIRNTNGNELFFKNHGKRDQFPISAQMLVRTARVGRNQFSAEMCAPSNWPVKNEWPKWTTNH